MIRFYVNFIRVISVIVGIASLVLGFWLADEFGTGWMFLIVVIAAIFIIFGLLLFAEFLSYYVDIRNSTVALAKKFTDYPEIDKIALGASETVRKEQGVGYKYCPKCKGEYYPEHNTCGKCNVDLVSEQVWKNLSQGSKGSFSKMLSDI